VKLYHGTSGSGIGSIIKSGIRPRGRRRGNWKQYPSRADMVYMTTAYPLWFAIQSVSEKCEAVVLEVDSDRLDERLMHPDEDFIAQAVASHKKCGVESIHDEIRKTLEHYQEHWKDSVAHLGNCAFRGVVPFDAVTRYCTIDLENQKPLILNCDPSISLLNYRFCGEKYRSLVSWLFGDRPDYLIGHGDNEFHFKIMEPHDPEYQAKAERMFANREGITVVEVER